MASSELCSQHSGFESRIEGLENSDTQQWLEIKGLRNRLPLWATVLISSLTFLLGASMTYASMTVKMVELIKHQSLLVFPHTLCTSRSSFRPAVPCENNALLGDKKLVRQTYNFYRVE